MNANVIIGLIILVIIVFFILNESFFSKKAVVVRKLKKANTKRISSFVNGEVAKIVGKIECIGTLLIAPLSGRKCVYYYILIEQRVKSGETYRWKKLIEEEVAGTFGIRDWQYCAQIDSKNIMSHIAQDRNYSSGFFNNASENLNCYLEKHGKKSINFFGFNKTLRYKEGVLEEGEMISVMGKGTWKNADQGQWSDKYGKVLIINSYGEIPVYLSDDPETLKNKDAFLE